ncbi:tetratricopeptide repeat protein [Fibrella aquatica]|uniref:tetratricopeptide repeat protein n=1 Tax=Fibrella aquatica TaxID=3242487 RepID=UPI0035219E3E
MGLMEDEFASDLRVLTNALRHDGFRFILIGHNRKSIYTDIATYLRNAFPDRSVNELALRGKSYRAIIDSIQAVQRGILLIPDFDWLFREENNELRVAFNQRRDSLARLPIALICFIEPGSYINVPNKIPDWWSLRSMELDFYRESSDTTLEPLESAQESSSLGGQTKGEKEDEIERLLQQVANTDPENQQLLGVLYNQIGKLYYELAIYETALTYLEQSLAIQQAIGDRSGEGTTLNNISQIFSVRGDFEKALTYLEQSLAIRQAVGDRSGEGTTLNNISQIYNARGDFEKALTYLEQSLAIRQAVGDRSGEGVTLNNISLIYMARGGYEKALPYLEQSLAIRQAIGDRRGEGVTLNNISQIYNARGDFEKALTYLEQSLAIRQAIGDRSGEGATLNNMGVIYFRHLPDINKAVYCFTKAHQLFIELNSPNVKITLGYLHEIIEEIGDVRYREILQQIGNVPTPDRS